MDENKLAYCSGNDATLNYIAAVKAKQNTLRERLAARRQRHGNMLSLVTGSGRICIPANVASFLSPKSTLNSVVPKSFAKKDFEFFSQLPEKQMVGVSQFPQSGHHLNEELVADEYYGKLKCFSSSDSRIPSTKYDVESVQSTDSSPMKYVPTNLYESEKNQCNFVHSTNYKYTACSVDRLKCETKASTSGIVNSLFGGNTTTIATVVGSGSLNTELEHLLGAETIRERENKRVHEEVMELLNRQSTKERFLNQRFRTQGGSQVKQFCSYGTRTECSKSKSRSGDLERCDKLHFRKIIHPHTDESLGDCSFLNTCFHVDTCKYVHYTIDYSEENCHLSTPTKQLNSLQSSTVPAPTTRPPREPENLSSSSDAEMLCNENGNPLVLYPPQWINCDIRLINMSVLGKFSVIMADPPWDIHMELPYGTMSDDEMRRLDIPCLQDDGYLFLWVTGRAMELGRECLRLWGYERVDEIIWVKTNQLQRLIRTGRTGHWLNHGKEHCLVGLKGNPQGVNRGIDCDIIVSEVRETSHKPDEIYGIIERLSPGTRKLELFGRPHNLQPNWITLGNQLDGTYLVDPIVVERFKKQYPSGLDMQKV